MSETHTPFPWRQGITLQTKITSRWSPEKIAKNDAIEKTMVFSNFTGQGEGQGRVLVAACTNQEDARLISSIGGLLVALEKVEELAELACEDAGSNRSYSQLVEIRDTARAARLLALNQT